MDGPPAQSLGVEPVDERILRAPPRKVTDPIVTRALLTRAVSSAVLITFLTLLVFAHELGKLLLKECLPNVLLSVPQRMASN
jgi:Ca2+-transporting ATPase